MSESSAEDCNLGKREYWEETYTEELANLEDTGDEGEIWFGEDVLDTMVAWTDQILQQRLTDAKQASILDVGTGNGSFLFSMAAQGYENLTGTDYTPSSILLAQAIATRRKMNNISWVKDDLLDSQLPKRYDVVTDKGTFDAVGLSVNGNENRRAYRMSIHKILKPGGLLIITSCNNTAQELQQIIQIEMNAYMTKGRPVQEEFGSMDDGGSFDFLDMVNSYPVFKFAGMEGTKVCTLAFQRRDSCSC